MHSMYEIPTLPLPYDLETRAVMKQLVDSRSRLAELRGIAGTIPNEQILISTLMLQEAKDSSSVENIVTTQDDLYKATLGLKQHVVTASTKEVLAYREAVTHGFYTVRDNRLLTNKVIRQIQSDLEHNSAGFRKVPGTTLQRADGQSVYTPPQDGRQIEQYMQNLEAFINDESMCSLDPLIKLAIIHHQFESIHPFYDGNGRTGRIINVLYLVTSGLLDLPILYLSRYITHNKGEYYRLLQAVRDTEGDNSRQWEAWILFILKGIAETSQQTIGLVRNISNLMSRYKQQLRPMFGKLYKHELLNNLFYHPYTKIEFIQRDMAVGRKTASKYLDMIVAGGMLSKVKIGNANYYINDRLVDLFVNQSEGDAPFVPPVESVISIK